MIDLSPLIYTLERIPNGKFSISPCYKIYGSLIEQDIWKRLDYDILKTSPKIRKYTSFELQERWQRGHSAIAIHQKNIISHVSAIDILPAARHQYIESALGIYLGMQDDIWESATGWTLPSFRNCRIQLQLRQKLYQRFAKYPLLVGFCFGVGASIVLKKLGWSLVSWERIKFLSLLLGYWSENKFYHHRGHTIDLDGKYPFLQDKKNSETELSHDWNIFFHLWVNDVKAAIDIEYQLRKLTNNEFHKWKKVVI